MSSDVFQSAGTEHHADLNKALEIIHHIPSDLKYVLGHYLLHTAEAIRIDIPKPNNFNQKNFKQHLYLYWQ